MLSAVRMNCGSKPVSQRDGTKSSSCRQSENYRKPWTKKLPIKKLRTSIQVVDVKDLKPEVRSKVDDVVAQTSEEDMQSLWKSIDALPEAASALKAKGLSSS